MASYRTRSAANTRRRKSSGSLGCIAAHLLPSPCLPVGDYRLKKRVGRRQEAGGRRQEASGTRQKAGSRKLEAGGARSERKAEDSAKGCWAKSGRRWPLGENILSSTGVRAAQNWAAFIPPEALPARGRCAVGRDRTFTIEYAHSPSHPKRMGAGRDRPPGWKSHVLPSRHAQRDRICSA